MLILDQILNLERDAFLWLNEYNGSFFDTFMYLYSSKYVWIPLILVSIIIFTCKIERRESILFISCIVLTVILCDKISADVIKPMFEHLRPTHHPDYKDIVHTSHNYRGGRFGFVSSHAANGFGITVFSILVLRNRLYTTIYILWALLTCYTRIYLGVHFISDVLGGAILGTIIGLAIYVIYIEIRKKIFANNQAKLALVPISDNKINILCGMLVLTICVLLLASLILTRFVEEGLKESVIHFF